MQSTDQRSTISVIQHGARVALRMCDILTMVNKSDNDCRFEDTSFEGAAGSSVTITAPGAPGILESSFVPSSLYWSVFDIVLLLDFSPSYCDI